MSQNDDDGFNEVVGPSFEGPRSQVVLRVDPRSRDADTPGSDTTGSEPSGERGRSTQRRLEDRSRVRSQPGGPLGPDPPLPDFVDGSRNELRYDPDPAMRYEQRERRRADDRASRGHQPRVRVPHEEGRGHSQPAYHGRRDSRAYDQAPRHHARDGERPHYWGHRARVRERFAQGGAAALPDYEIVEMILFNAVPRIDVKPLAKKLLEDFGGFESLLTASRERLMGHPHTDEKIVHQLKLSEGIAIRLAKVRLAEKPFFSGTDAVVEYFRTTMAHLEIEHFHVLYLDNRNYLIADEEHGRGTVNHTPAYPREVARRALELNAVAVVLVHNHPSGDPKPSRQDIEMTQRMKSTLGVVNVNLLDHLIIGKGSETSLAALGAMD